MANIMLEEFGDSLIRTPPDGPPKLEHLPSPDQLKGKVMLKALEPLAPNFSEPGTQFSNAFGVAVNLHLACTPQIRPSSSSGANSSSPPRLPRRGSIDPSQDVLCSAALLVYTVGVKCRGINKKEQYAVEHMFSLSENTINKMLKEVTYGSYDGDPDNLTDTGGVGKGGMMDLIKHCRTHLVRTYPRGMRVDSSNYEPHRYWSAGAQLVAINWQTCGRLPIFSVLDSNSSDLADVGFMINHAMFQRNGRCGYVLKPLALRSVAHKHLLSKRTNHFLDVTIISAQQLPRPKDGKTAVDPTLKSLYMSPIGPISLLALAASQSQW
ncbi:Phospholipase [Salix suchowensis]|nr:Phospholipase [Salix suchowensis]